jgi:hypothetical protein
MSKYHVYLAENWDRTEPFTVDWDYELIGDKFRAEFDTYFAEQERLAGAGVRKSKQLFKGEVVKRFMIQKRINLVDDPATGNLKSVFVIRVGEKKVIDGRAKKNLASRFEWTDRGEDEKGKKLQPTGFLKFEWLEGQEEDEIKKNAVLQIEGNDIEYFNDEPENEVQTEEKVEEVKEEFVCDVCGKSFKTGASLRGHKLSHTKAK